MATSTRRSSRSRSSKPSATSAWDFTKEEGGAARFKEGDYLCHVLKKAKPGTSEDKGTPYIEFTFKFLEGKYEGKTITQRLYNTPKALWLTRTFIEAVGEEVPESASDWKSIARLVIDKDVIITISDNPRDDGRVFSQISDFTDPDEYDADDDDDFEDDDDLEDDAEEDEDDDDLEDEEDEDDEPAPRKRRPSRSKPAAKKKTPRKRRPADDEDDDDLDDLDLDDL